MLRNRTGTVLVMAIVVFFCSVGSLLAASALLQVRATILPYANIDVRQQIAGFNISAADLERSYIDLPLSATINIDTNVEVLILTVVPSGEEQVLAGLSGSNLFANSIEIVLTASERYTNHVTRDLDFRVLLDEETRVGSYALNPWLSVQGY